MECCILSSIFCIILLNDDVFLFCKIHCNHNPNAIHHYNKCGDLRMNSYQLKGTFIIQVNEVSENTIAQYTPLLKTGEHWCTERRSFNSPTHFFVSASVLYIHTYEFKHKVNCCCKLYSYPESHTW